jgi:23S rRNA pseudouridine1911/1915/1917 synthase
MSTPIVTTSILSARTEPSPGQPSAGADGDRIEVVAAPDQAGERADRFLASAIGSLSRSRVKALIGEGRVARDGVVLRDPSEAVRPGALYRVSVPVPVAATPVPQAMPLTILHEDRELIVLDKPAGLVVHPAPGNLDGTLVNALLAHAGEDLPGIGGEKRPGIVHRLDKDTSGLMVVAKTERAHHALSAAFATREGLQREYLALVWGLPEPLAGEIEAPIGRHPMDRKRMAVVLKGGKPATTRYATRQAFHGSACALLRCRLLTGRTHQIRVHLAERGHPIIGDPVYLRRTPGAARLLPEALRAMLLGFPRQALHATTLGFNHPVTGLPLLFESPPPADMQALLSALGMDASKVASH